MGDPQMVDAKPFLPWPVSNASVLKPPCFAPDVAKPTTWEVAAARKIQNFFRRKMFFRELTRSRATPGATSNDDEDEDDWTPTSRNPKTPKTPAGMRKKWQWPPWVLDHKKPDIEVYVEDEDTESGKWHKAQPVERVVDDDGEDAYLHAEYMWHGEVYRQDFGPHEVRKRGQHQTVWDLFEEDADGVTDSHLKRADFLNGMSSFIGHTSSVASSADENLKRSELRRRTLKTTKLTRWLFSGARRKAE